MNTICFYDTIRQLSNNYNIPSRLLLGHETTGLTISSEYPFFFYHIKYNIFQK